MAFWSDAALDPKRQFKFKVTFNYVGNNGEATYLAQSADRPVYTITDGTKVDFLDKAFHFPGKISWTPVKIKFVDAVDSNSDLNVSKKVYDYLGSAGWINPTRMGGALDTPGNLSTISKYNAVNNAQTNSIRIEVLSSDGRAVDKWLLKNAFVTTAALNNLDYAAEGILTAEFTFRYDWAEMEST